jgi:predicted DCC family thiol-disulfide oxidoreductase YuxK
MKLLGGGWGIFYLFILVPRFIRDSIYAFIARNRYKWFGQRSECLMPTAELKGRFL